MWEVEIIKKNARKRVDESVYFDSLSDAEDYFNGKVKYFDGMFINSRYDEVFITVWDEEFELVDSKDYF